MLQNSPSKEKRPFSNAADRGVGATTGESAIAALADPLSAPPFNGPHVQWEAVRDALSGKTYFFDRTSGRSVWEIPETTAGGLLRGGAPPRLPAFSEERTGSAVSPPRIMPARDQAEAVAARSAEAVRANRAAGQWESAIDPATRRRYYFNRATGERSWTMEEARALEQEQHHD